jgi:Transcriptional antiterminator
MRALKKINNNVAICIDNSGKELIAFGIGIGFPQMPYEIKDLSKIDRTFYNISNEYLKLLDDIPFRIIEFTAKMVIFIENHLSYSLNSNLVLTLADHISFAIERAKKHIYVRMPLSYDMEQMYQDEMQISMYIIEQIETSFQIRLQKDEASGIAMAIVNARLLPKKGSLMLDESKFDKILEGTTAIIEQEMHISVNRKSFNYTRYATHIHYLLQRIFESKYVDSDNLSVYRLLKEEYVEVSECVEKIEQYYHKELKCTITEEEKLYLILHVNRVCAKEGL